MKFNNGKIISDIKIISPDIQYDFRGEYIETYNQEAYKNIIRTDFVQDDISISKKNVLRGLHGDTVTTKLIQCVFGSIMLVAVDMRKESKTYLKHEIFYINDKNRTQILIPANFANGHLCLSEQCIFSYKQSEYFSGTDKQFTLKWNDPILNIYWPAVNPILSGRDNFGPFVNLISL